MTGTNSGLAEIKSRQQKAWSSGNYAVVGTTLQIVGESLCEAVDLRSGARVLDVAAGNGNATLAAARRFAEVTSTDYVPALLESGRSRAAAEGASVHFQEAAHHHVPARARAEIPVTQEVRHLVTVEIGRNLDFGKRHGVTGVM